jgi:hypothetical protein
MLFECESCRVLDCRLKADCLLRQPLSHIHMAQPERDRLDSRAYVVRVQSECAAISSSIE